MNIQIIASGSSGNCYKVGDGDTTVLLDAGVAVSKIRKAVNFTLRDISAVLLTHEHGDHSAGVLGLSKYGITTYSGRGTFEALGVSGFNFKAVEHEKQIQIGSFRVLPFKVEHDAAEPLGFLLRSDKTNESLLYITDSYYCGYRFGIPLNYIILEVNFVEDILRQNQESGAVPYAKRVWTSHMGLKTAVELLRANNLSHLEETFICHLSDANSDAKKIKQTIQEVTGAPVTIC